MKSIWDNTFYQAQPALSWVYKLDMTNYVKTISGDSTIIEPKDAIILNESIISVSLGKRESEFAPIYYGGVESKIFTRAKTSDSFTIKFSEDKNFNVTNVFEKIYNFENIDQDYPYSKNDGVYNHNITDEQQYTNFNSRQITIKMFDPNKLPDDEDTDSLLARLDFYGCKLASLSDIEFSYESTEAITRDVTFFYNFMRFTKRPWTYSENTEAG